jgi:plastocyanin
MNKIRRFTFAGVAIATTSLFYFSAAHQNPVTAHQHPMPEVQSAAAQAPVNNATVTIESFQFKPNNVVLKKGGKITFINKDSAPHTATPENGAQFTGTGRIRKNESKIVTFNTVGEQKYFCEIHPSMKGKITVVE